MRQPPGDLETVGAGM